VNPVLDASRDAFAELVTPCLRHPNGNVHTCTYAYHCPVTSNAHWDVCHSWPCDSDYRGLKKRIKAIRQEQGRSLDDSSEPESDPDPLLRGSGASAHLNDGEQIVDEDHEADESDIQRGRHGQQTVVDARDGEIELEELTDGHSKVRLLHVLSLACIKPFLKATTSASPDATSVTQLQPIPKSGLTVTSVPMPETHPSGLSLRDPRPRDGLRRRTTGRRDCLSRLVPRSDLTLSCFFFSSHPALFHDVINA